MSAIKRLLVLSCTLLAMSTISFAQDGRGQRLLGELTFGLSEANLGLGVAYVHPLDQTFELAGEFSYYLPFDPVGLDDGFSRSWCFWMFMANCYATFERIEGFEIYGIGGLGLTNSRLVTTYEENDQILQEHSETNFGGQLGLGANKELDGGILAHFEVLIPVGDANSWFGTMLQLGVEVPVF